MKSRFHGLKSTAAPEPPPGAASEPAPAGRPKTSRAGKKAVAGYFSPELSRSLHLLGLEQDKSLQALLGEAIDDLMRKYGKHPFGER
jgi:hypothetical protein